MSLCVYQLCLNFFKISTLVNVYKLLTCDGGGGGGDYNRGENYNRGDYNQRDNDRDNYNDVWVNPGVVVPNGGYSTSPGECSVVQQCDSYGNCSQTQVCN